MYDAVNTSHGIFNLTDTWGEGHKIGDATGSNSDYLF